MKTLKQGGAWLIGLAIMVAFWGNLTRVGESLKPPFVYWKDCNQPYVMGRALLSGADPYAPLPTLGEAFLPEARFADHPTPYPPLVALLGVPLAMMPYGTAARVWLGGELACLAAALLLLANATGARLTAISLVVAFGVVLVVRPVSEELRQGQFMSGLLLLLCLAWRSLRRNQDAVGGALLGLLISIKLIAWPLVLLLAMRGRLRAVKAALLAIVAAHAIMLPLIGFSGIVDYYVRVGPLNASVWRPAEGNYSMWGWSHRLFSGFGFSFSVEPLWAAPRLADILTPVLPSLGLALSLWLARRASRFDTAFSLVVGASLLLSPICWTFYLLLSALPLAVLGRRLALMGWPAGITGMAAFMTLLLAVGSSPYEELARAFGHHPPGGPFLIVPFGAGLVLLTPVAALFGLLWLIWRTDGVTLGESGE